MLVKSIDGNTATLEYVSGDIPEIGMDYVRLGNTSDPNRQGNIYLTSDDSGSPFMDVITGITSHSDWNTPGKVKMRVGRLDGITSETNEFGFIAGVDGYGINNAWMKATNLGIRLNNTDLRVYDGGTLTAWIDPTDSGKLALGANASTITVANSTAGTILNGAGHIKVYQDSANYLRYDNGGFDLRVATRFDIQHVSAGSPSHRLQVRGDASGRRGLYSEVFTNATTVHELLSVGDIYSIVYSPPDAIATATGRRGIAYYEFTGSAANRLFELSDSIKEIAGWTFTHEEFTSGNLALKSSGRVEAYDSSSNLRGLLSSQASLDLSPIPSVYSDLTERQFDYPSGAAHVYEYPLYDFSGHSQGQMDVVLERSADGAPQQISVGIIARDDTNTNVFVQSYFLASGQTITVEDFTFAIPINGNLKLRITLTAQAFTGWVKIRNAYYRTPKTLGQITSAGIRFSSNRHSSLLIDEQGISFEGTKMSLRLPAMEDWQIDNLTSVKNGMIAYDTTNHVFKGFINGVWQELEAGGGGGGVTSVSAGNGMDFSTITTSGAVTLGTPSNITSTSSNSVTSTSHTHALNTTGVVSGTYGSTIQVPVFTVDNKGRLTSAANQTIRSASASQSGVVTTAAQTFAGNKTFNGSIIAVAGITLDTTSIFGLSNNLLLGSDDGDIVLTTDGANELRLANSGYVGMGTDSPSRPLHIVANTNTSTIAEIRMENQGTTYTSLSLQNTISSPGSRIVRLQHAANYFAIGFWSETAGTLTREVMRLVQGGNVGIGLSTPLAPLHVNGNIRTQGVYQVGTSSGITATRSWFDMNSMQTHTVQIVGGIITSWTVV
jgi:hypothetical protein